jgi:FXSXX-COOH protein
LTDVGGSAARMGVGVGGACRFARVEAVGGGQETRGRAGDLPSGLIDLTGLDLGDVASLDRAVLADALSLVLADNDVDEAVAGFQSSI